MIKREKSNETAKVQELLYTYKYYIHVCKEFNGKVMYHSQTHFITTQNKQRDTCHRNESQQKKSTKKNKREGKLN